MCRLTIHIVCHFVTEYHTILVLLSNRIPCDSDSVTILSFSFCPIDDRGSTWNCFTEKENKTKRKRESRWQYEQKVLVVYNSVHVRLRIRVKYILRLSRNPSKNRLQVV